MKASPAVFYRALFLSDFHIGAKSFDADSLLDFLKKHDCETLYLVGDIIDGWKLQKRWYWTESASAVLDELIRKAHNGTKIIYLTGNHDEAVRFLPLYRRLRFARRFGIQIKNKIVHETARGQKFLVLHGDQFDRPLLYGPLSKISDRLYDLFLEITGGHGHTTITINGREKPFSLAKFLGTQGQRALNMLNDLERMIVQMARDEKADGIICGHTHIPALKSIRGVIYANCGAWLRGHHTALAEDTNGDLTLIDWPHSYQAEQPCLFAFEETLVQLTPDTSLYRPLTEKIIGSVRRTFAREKESAVSMSARRMPVRARLSRLLLAHQICLQTDESDHRMGDQICWNPL